MSNQSSLSCNERFSLYLERYANGNGILAFMCRICRFVGRKCHLVLDESACQNLLIQQQIQKSLLNQSNILNRPCQLGSGDLLSKSGEETLDKNGEETLSKSGEDERICDTLNDIYFLDDDNDEQKESDVNYIKNDSLFKYIDELKKGNVDEFKFYDYLINELKIFKPESALPFVELFINVKVLLLWECKDCTESDKKQVLIEFYKVIFNALQNTEEDCYGRFKISDSFRNGKNKYYYFDALMKMGVIKSLSIDNSDGVTRVHNIMCGDVWHAMKKITEKYNNLVNKKELLSKIMEVVENLSQVYLFEKVQEESNDNTDTHWNELYEKCDEEAKPIICKALAEKGYNESEVNEVKRLLDGSVSDSNKKIIVEMLASNADDYHEVHNETNN